MVGGIKYNNDWGSTCSAKEQHWVVLVIPSDHMKYLGNRDFMLYHEEVMCIWTPAHIIFKVKKSYESYKEFLRYAFPKNQFWILDDIRSHHHGGSVSENGGDLQFYGNFNENHDDWSWFYMIKKMEKPSHPPLSHLHLINLGIAVPSSQPILFF